MNRFVAFFAQHPQLLKQKIAIAFSGGSDSLCLLFLMKTLFKTENIVALYVNHSLRSDSELNNETCINQNNCKLLGIDYLELYCEKGEIEQIEKKRGSGIEDAARMARYSKLFSYCKKNNISTIATAHTSDDQVETMIMRTFNGSSPLSLTCVKEISVIQDITVLRPVLSYSKKELQQILVKNKLSWSEDSTNVEEDYLRNKIRLKIAPSVEEIFPFARETVLRNAKIFEDFQYLVKEKVDFLIKDNCCETELYCNQVTIVRYNIIISLSKDYCVPSYGQLKHIDNIIMKKKLKSVNFNDFDLVFRDGRIFFTKVIEDNHFTFIIEKRDNKTINFEDFIFSISSSKIFDDKALQIADEDLHYPLVFRTQERGDFLDTAGGTVLISKFVSSWKIQENKRKLVYVLEDREGIVAVFGRHVGGRDRLAKRMKNTLVGKTVRIYSILNKDIKREIV